MSFIEQPGDGLNRIGPVPAAPPEPRVEEQPPAAETTPEPEPETFTREYVEGLRRENANLRTRGRDWLAVTDGMEPELEQAWQGIIQAAQSGDPEALVAIGQALGFIDAEAPAETAQPSGEAQYLTRDEAMRMAREIADEAVQSRIAETEQARAQAEAVTQIQSRARNDFGIDPTSDDYVLLLKYANEIDPETLPPGEDLLSAAHKQLQASLQARWEAFVANKEGEARQTPTFPTGGGQPSTAAPSPKTWAEARARLGERLANL